MAAGGAWLDPAVAGRVLKVYRSAAAAPGRDAERMAIVRRVTDAYQQAVAELPPARRSGADVRAVRWMIEELRVSLFAQVLGTSGPVSEKRILTALDKLAAG